MALVMHVLQVMHIQYYVCTYYICSQEWYCVFDYLSGEGLIGRGHDGGVAGAVGCGLYTDMDVPARMRDARIT